MPQQYTKYSKICATCNFWRGYRELDISRQKVECDSWMSVGKCLQQSSGWTNQPRQAQQNCVYWEKWCELK